MRKWNPSYLRTFVVTAAVIGLINMSLFRYYLQLPLVPTGRGERLVKHPSDLFVVMMAFNSPGTGMTALVMESRPKTEGTTLVGMAVAQAVSTIFWACVAVAIDWLVSQRRKRRARVPDSAPGIPLKLS